MLRGIDWFVSDEEIEFAIIGRPVLEALGCDNRKILTAASDKSGGVIDIPKDLKGRLQEKYSGSVSAIFLNNLDGVYHSHGGVEQDNIPEGNVYLEVGEDEKGECEEYLEKAVMDGKGTGLSNQGFNALQNLLKKYCSIFG